MPSQSASDAPTRQENSDSPNRMPSAGDLLAKFIVGSCFLAVVSAFFAAAFDNGSFPDRFVRIFVAVMGGTVFGLVVLLIWMSSSALDENSQPQQFRLVSLFYLTALAAAYFAVVRWLATMLEPGEPGLEAFATAGILCVLLAMTGIVPLLFWSESVVWFAAWLVCKRFVQRWLFGRRPSRL